MFSCWMYFYEILTRTKTNRHSISMLLITYKFWTQNLILPAVELGRNTCVSVCVCERVYAHAWAGSTTPAAEQVFSLVKSSSSSRFAFGRFPVHTACQQHWWQVRVSLVSSWVSFAFSLQTTVWNNYWNIVHNKLEVCYSLPQIWLTVYIL